MMLKFLLFLGLVSLLLVSPVWAVSDPRSNPNNIVGINILSPEAEIEEAASLVNSNGDWGWAVIVIKKSERNLDRWQGVFNLMARYHLIPIVRLATDFDDLGYWRRPSEEDVKDWADFLSKLYWPTKNRYVQIYNEVNRASEWGGKVDAFGYAVELNKTIDALRAKSSDFFILNAPLDLSLETAENALDAAVFLQTMENTSSGVFEKLDGWASHSYPNPGFSASPLASGRTGIDGFKWELNMISDYINNRDLPVFITETGWRRANKTGGLSEEQIAQNYKIAFEKIWSDARVMVVAPFVFDFPEALFNEFSFSANNDEKKYYDYYFAVKDLAKVKGEPVRENLASDLQISQSYLIIQDFSSEVTLKISNIGNYIWNTQEGLSLDAKSENMEVGPVVWDREEVYPGQEITGTFKVKSKVEGTLPFSVKIRDGDQVLAQKDITFLSETYLSLFINALKTVFDIIG
ncbi:hypothetical protein HYU92_06810 [Candidatus Curtissbacteria bacterium]|nr:hypothetical protein [Candidatus Curtissbacteria bacterium]